MKMLRFLAAKRVTSSVRTYSKDVSVDVESLNSQGQTVKSRSKTANPETSSYIFFPGQGSQYVGMAKDLIQYPEVANMFEIAKQELGFDLLKICLNGPQQKLDETRYCQPAVFVASLAALERLKVLHPEAISNCVATAGFSLGEITALTFAGAIPFDKALKLVKLRAELMQKASEENLGGMATLLYGHDSKINEAIQKAKEWAINKGVENADCRIANYLFPDCKVISGSLEALKYIEANLKTYKIKKIRRLPVSGAFHSSLMQSAVQPFSEALRDIFISPPIVDVYSNVYALPFKSPTNIISTLPKQIVLPVKWEQILHTLYTRAPHEKFPPTYFCGPGTALKTILKQVNARACENAVIIEA